MLLISPALGANTAPASEDAETGEEDNPADTDDDGGDSESLFGGTCFLLFISFPINLILLGKAKEEPNVIEYNSSMLSLPSF